MPLDIDDIQKSEFSPIIDIVRKEEIQLMKRGLILDTKKYSPMMILSNYGYDNVFNNYQSRFLTDPKNKSSKFKKGTKFSEIVDFFYFDMLLRKEVFSSMQLFELKLKQAIGLVVSNYISPTFKIYHQQKYFKEKKIFYDPNKKIVEIAQRSSLRKSMKVKVKKAGHNLNPLEMSHHLYFRQNAYWYYLLPTEIKEKIAEFLSYGPFLESQDNIKNEEKGQNFYQVIDDMLRLYIGCRNQAAHEGKIFDYYNPNISLNYRGMYYKGKNRLPSDKQYHCGIGLLIFWSYLLVDKELFRRLSNSVYSVLINFLKMYPQNNDLIHVMGLDVLDGIDDRYKKLIK